MRYSRVFLVVGVLALTYGVGYCRGHLGARISQWCDERAARRFKRMS
jgi:hypothetical protein